MRFQFHKGTIRTYINDDEDKAVPNFNSIKVQLEHKNLSEEYREACISIP